MDTTFRTPQTPAIETTPKSNRADVTQTDSNVEVPYTDYEKTHGKPYTVDHFQLGDTWQEDLGGFAKEVSTIEEFFSKQIESGSLPNNKEAIKAAIRKMEKVTNLDKNERPIVKIETISAYVKFLMDVDNIKFNVARYGHN